MAGPSWLVDGNRIATKIKSASNPERVEWESNPTRACPKCQHVIDNSDVIHKWPGLPQGVKFDPTDQEIIWHLRAKVGKSDLKPHPFIEEFVPTVNNDDGICYAHPKNLPGVKQDGSSSHFFHRAVKAYNTGTRKRRKIQGDDFGDVRWHKTGRTKPVILDGVQVGNKKIMVLYMSSNKCKSEKTNWVMHQYHLGTEEDEHEGEYVVSKIFYQQQQSNKNDKTDGVPENVDAIVTKADPLTPMSVTPDPPCAERRYADFMTADTVVGEDVDPELPGLEYVVDDVALEIVKTSSEDKPVMENHGDHARDVNGQDFEDNTKWWEGESQTLLDSQQIVKTSSEDKPVMENRADHVMNVNGQDFEDNTKWWEGESQTLLDSQQLVEGLALCDEFLQSQSPARDGGGSEITKGKPRLADYAQLGPEHLKKDLEECQNLELDAGNIERDTPPDFRLSQLEFGSQDSFLAWGVGKVTD